MAQFAVFCSEQDGCSTRVSRTSKGPLLLSSLCLVSALEGADMALLPAGHPATDSLGLGFRVSCPVCCKPVDDMPEAVFYALQTDLGLHLNDLATMTLIQAHQRNSAILNH